MSRVRNLDNIKLTELDWTKRLWHYYSQQNGNRVAVGRERVLWDGTRVDILLPDLAIEVDYAEKWAEAIGQSLWYSNNTGRPPGIILLISSFEKELQFIYRCQVICSKYNIKLILVDTLRNEIITDDIERSRATLPEV